MLAARRRNDASARVGGRRDARRRRPRAPRRRARRCASPAGAATSSKRPRLELLQLGHQRVEAAALLVDQHDVARADALRRRPPRRRRRGRHREQGRLGVQAIGRTSYVAARTDSQTRRCSSTFSARSVRTQTIVERSADSARPQRRAERRRRRPRALAAERRTARRRGRSRARAASRRAARTPRPAPATGRKLKMPPPSLSISTITSFAPEARRGQQPADVVGERDVADQQHDRPARGERPRRTRSRPCRRSRSRRGWRARGTAPRGRGRTSRRRGSASRRRRPASTTAAARRPARRPRAARRAPTGPTAAAIAPRRGPVGLAPVVQPRRSPALRDLLASASTSSPRVGADDQCRRRPAGSCHAPSGSNGDLQRVRAPPARCAAAWRSGGRRRAARARARAPPPTPATRSSAS